MNGINAVFMVESVSAVSPSAKLKKENRSSGSFMQGQSGKSSLFAEILETTAKNTTPSTEAPREFNNVVYGKNMMFSSMQYKTREYR